MAVNERNGAKPTSKLVTLEIKGEQSEVTKEVDTNKSIDNQVNKQIARTWKELSSEKRVKNEKLSKLSSREFSKLKPPRH
ncbi:hypothetical protein F0562_008021 [Nyssa sinensis]|uniref:Uncharacterized protein n=1 Tax=Nyssa sinensis TaxID=561372 RepID=A0A5J5A702_9ASTE|nr:hypothetical protein F0562_008021 [Nyssa sinensis]